jgi:hypothetical protein
MTDGLKKENMINKNMKNIIFILSLFFYISSFSQDCTIQNKPNWGNDSLSCRQNVSLYSEFLKQKTWLDASNAWWKAQKVCPMYKPNLYANGTYIYRKMASEKVKEKSPNANAYVDSLFMIYDLWIENYGLCDEIKLKSANDIMKFKPKNGFEKAYQDYQSVFNSNKGAMSYGDVKLCFYSAIYMFNNKKIDCDGFLMNYENMSDICDMNIKAEVKADKFKKVQIFLDNSISQCATCDKLEEIYSAKLAKDSTNMDLTRKVFKVLSAKKCTESDFYLNLLDVVLNDPNNPPTAEDLINAALADHKRKEYSLAKDRFLRALGMSEINDDLKQKCYTFLYDIAYKRNNYNEAFRLASSISDNCVANEKKAYAVAISVNKCGSSPLEKSLIYCLALDYAEKSCGNVGASTVNSWKSALLPMQELVMMNETKGSSYNISCWNKATILRSRD